MSIGSKFFLLNELGGIFIGNQEISQSDHNITKSFESLLN